MKTPFYQLFILFFISFLGFSCSSTPQLGVQSSDNPVMDNILSRKSVRKYQDKSIEPEKMDLLMRAGMAAPSGRDVRPWEFVIVNERARLDTMAASLPYAKMLTHAPCAIIVCGDSARSFYWYLDCSAAAQNILLAAESIGLGAVWTAAYPYEDRMKVVSETLELPAHILPLCVIPVGYPDGEYQPKDKSDRSKIHYNKY
ncbi:MAG: nitroreductase family protein [Bacteroides sp.]|nr:nitroreductase family protein [Bacteroides sp.]